MAGLGIAKVDDMIGRCDLLEFGDLNHWKARNVDLPNPAQTRSQDRQRRLRNMEKQDHGIAAIHSTPQR